MSDKENNKKTPQPEKNETVELDIEQLEHVAGGDRGGQHKPPTRPGN